MKMTPWMGAAVVAFAFGCAHQAVKSRQLRGTVSDVTGNAILVQSPDNQGLALDITDQSDFTLNGRSVSPMELPRGADIRVSYELQGDRPVVTRAEAKANPEAEQPIENTP